MVDDSRIRSLCTLAATENDFIVAVNRLKSEPYRDTEKREKVLKLVLDDAENAKKIATVLTSAKTNK
jgi:hypothetical protein